MDTIWACSNNYSSSDLAMICLLYWQRSTKTWSSWWRDSRRQRKRMIYSQQWKGQRGSVTKTSRNQEANTPMDPWSRKQRGPWPWRPRSPWQNNPRPISSMRQWWRGSRSQWAVKPTIKKARETTKKNPRLSRPISPWSRRLLSSRPWRS